MCGKIGDNIVEYRRLNGISQKYLAEKIGVSTQGLYKIEKGLASPRAETLEKIMTILCITPNQLFGIEPITTDNSSIIEKLRNMSKM